MVDEPKKVFATIEQLAEANRKLKERHADSMIARLGVIEKLIAELQSKCVACGEERSCLRELCAALRADLEDLLKEGGK